VTLPAHHELPADQPCAAWLWHRLCGTGSERGEGPIVPGMLHDSCYHLVDMLMTVMPGKPSLLLQPQTVWPTMAQQHAGRCQPRAVIQMSEMFKMLWFIYTRAAAPNKIDELLS
jgi:hypothetical protein